MLNLAEKYQQIYALEFSQILQRHKRASSLTTQQIAGHLGVPKTTVDKWLTGETAPHAGNLMALAVCLGAGFLNDVLRPFGFSGVHEIDAGACNPFVVNATAADALSVLSRSLQDGVIDHQEAFQVRHQLQAFVAEANKLIAQLPPGACLAV